MKWLLSSALVLSFSTSVAFAQDATKADAEKMVKDTIKSAVDVGFDATYALMAKGKFKKGEIYSVAYDTTGVCKAHPVKPERVGKKATEAFMEERIARLPKSGDTLWQTYKFSNPVTKLEEDKLAYCERMKEIIFCAGVYKK